MAGRVVAKTEKPVQNAVAEFAADRPQAQVQTEQNPSPDTKKPGDGFQKTPRRLKGGDDTARKGLGSPLFGGTITSYAETAAVSRPSHRQKNAEPLKNYAALLAKTREQMETAFSAWFRAEARSKEYNITSSFKAIYNFVFSERELSDPYNSVDGEALAEWRERIGKIDNSLKLARAAIKNAEEGYPVSRGIDEDFLYEDGTILRLAEMERLGTPLTFEDETALELDRMKKFNSGGRWISALGSYAALQSSYLDYMPEVTRLPNGACSFASQVNTMIGHGLVKTRLSMVATSRDLELVRKDIEQYNLELARELGRRMGPALGDRGYIDIRNVDAEIARLMEIENFEPATRKLIEKAEKLAHRIANEHREDPEFERWVVFFRGIGKLANDPALLTMVLAGYASGIIGAWAESRLVAMGLQGWRLDAARLAIHGISFHNANNLLNFAIARPDHVDLTLGGNLRTTAVLWWLGRIQKWYGANAMPRYAGLMKADPLLFRKLNLIGMKSAEVAGLASMNLAFCVGVNGPDCLSLDNIQTQFVESAQFVIAYGAFGAARSRTNETPVEKGLELAKGRFKKEGERLKELRGRLATDSSGTIRPEYEVQEKRTAEAGVRAFKAAETYLKEQAAALLQRQRMDPLAGYPNRAEAHRMARALVDDEIQRVRTAHEKVQKWIDDYGRPVVVDRAPAAPRAGEASRGAAPRVKRGKREPDIAGFHAAVEDKLNNPKPAEERTGRATWAASRGRGRRTGPRARVHSGGRRTHIATDHDVVRLIPEGDAPALEAVRREGITVGRDVEEGPGHVDPNDAEKPPRKRDPEAGSVEMPEGMLTGFGKLIAGAKRLFRRGADVPEGEAVPKPATLPLELPTNAAEYTYTADGREESLVGNIDGLTPELEREFRQGYRILTARDGDGAVTYYPIRHVDRSIGQTIKMHPLQPGSIGYEAMVREHAIYEAWKARAGFGEIAEADARRNFNRLEVLLKREGIAFSSSRYHDEEPQFNPDHGMQYGQIADLLELCPAALLRSGVIKKIVISKDRVGDARASVYKDGDVLLYVHLFDVGRKYFQLIVLHEIGHGIDHGLDADTKRHLYEQMGTIVSARAVIAVETPFEEVSTRAAYTSAFNEFLAEMNALYIMAGDYLRSEIAKIKNSDVKRAYQEIYDFYKNLHGGREFWTVGATDSNTRIIGGDLSEARASGVFVFTEAAESMGGGAGRNKMAINAFLDPETGRIVAMGNPQRVPDEFRDGNLLVSFEITAPITMAEQAGLGINLRRGTVPAGAAAEIRRLFEESVRRHDLEGDDPEYVRVMRAVLAVTTDTPESIANALNWRVANFTIEGRYVDGAARRESVTGSEREMLAGILAQMIGSPYKPMGGMRARISSDPRGEKAGR